MNRKFKQHKPHLFEIEIFRDIIDVFTVIFDQYYVSLLNKFLQKTLNLLMVYVYIVYIYK